MKRLVAKIRRIRRTAWSKLTLGEKVLDVVMRLLKWGVIIALGATVLGIVAVVVFGFIGAFAIAGAIAGGFGDASRAYRPGDRYVKFW